MHRHLIALFLSAFVLVARPGTSHADDTAAMLAKLDAGAQCADKRSVWRAWCPAVQWAKGKPGTLKPGVMVGITVAIQADADVAQALSDKVTFVILAIRKDGKAMRATLRDVTPDNDDEAAMLAEAVFATAGVLKGKAKVVTLASGLRAFADSLVAKAERQLTRTRTGWTWETDHNRAELRQIGAVRVVIETPKDGSAGRFITILTDKVK